MSELNKEDIEYIEHAEAVVWKLATIVKGNIELLEKIDKQIEHKLPHMRVKIEDAILMQMRTYQKVNELFPRLEELENTYVRNRSNELSLSGKSIKLYAPRIWNIINIVSKLKPSSIQNNWRHILQTNQGISISASYIRKTKLDEQGTNTGAKETSIDLISKESLVFDNFLVATFDAPQQVDKSKSVVQTSKRIITKLENLDNKIVKESASHKIILNQSNHSESIGELHIRGNKKYTDYLKSVGISGKIGKLAIIEPIVTSSNLVLIRD